MKRSKENLNYDNISNNQLELHFQNDDINMNKNDDMNINKNW